MKKAMLMFLALLFVGCSPAIVKKPIPPPPKECYIPAGTYKLKFTLEKSSCTKSLKPILDALPKTICISKNKTCCQSYVKLGGHGGCSVFLFYSLFGSKPNYYTLLLMCGGSEWIKRTNTLLYVCSEKYSVEIE